MYCCVRKYASDTATNCTAILLWRLAPLMACLAGGICNDPDAKQTVLYNPSSHFGFFASPPTGKCALIILATV
jgi:hypothetical protein